MWDKHFKIWFWRRNEEKGKIWRELCGSKISSQTPLTCSKNIILVDKYVGNCHIIWHRYYCIRLCNMTPVCFDCEIAFLTGEAGGARWLSRTELAFQLDSYGGGEAGMLPGPGITTECSVLELRDTWLRISLLWWFVFRCERALPELANAVEADEY